MASAREPMPAEALEAFRKAHELDAKDPRARYFLAVARDLTGDHKGAIADWLALLADTPAGAPWEADLRRTIEQVGKVNKIETTQLLAAVKQTGSAGGARGCAGHPRADARADAGGGIDDSGRAAPDGGGDGRAARRAAEGGAGTPRRLADADPQPHVAGQPDKARAALDAAVKANPGAAGDLRAQAKALGVP